MRNFSSLLAVAALVVGPMVVTAACSKDDGSSNRSTTPGPAEKAGQKVDETAHDAKEGVKEGAHDVKDAAKSAASAVGSATEKAGEKMQGKLARMSLGADERLRRATSDFHEHTRSLPLFRALDRGELPAAGYVALLRALRPLVAAVEEAAASGACPAAAQALRARGPSAPLLASDLASVDEQPHRIRGEAELQAAAAAQDLLLGARSEPARLAGYLHAIAAPLAPSDPAGPALGERVARALGSPADRAVAFVRRGDGPPAPCALGPEEAAQAEAGARAAFAALAAMLEALSPSSAPYPTAKGLNPDGGSHAVTDDPRELEAALRAGLRTWNEHPYYERRYGQRGRQFTRSDSGWLVTLARGPQPEVNGQIQWLGRLLSSRGMPRLLLERHLLALHDELVAAVPERAADYGRLRAAAEALADERRGALDDGRMAALAAEFDRAVGPELAAALPGAGELLAAAVADERCGVAQAVDGLTRWLADPAVFSAPWVAAVEKTLALARAPAPG